jgi:mitogen-activated protein kinase organizer 1
LKTADGKYCLTAGSDRTVRLWNPSRLDPAFPPSPIAFDDEIPVSQLPQSLPIQVYDVRHPATAVSIDATSTRLLLGSHKTALLLDSITAQQLRQWHGHTAVINSVDMVITGDVLASASYDATVCLWDGRSNSPNPIQVLKEAKDSVTCVSFMENAILRTASVDGCVRTYDIRKGLIQCDDYKSPITGLSHFDKEDAPSSSLLAASCLDGAIRVHPDQLLSDPHSHGSDRQISVSTFCKDGHVAGNFGLECSFSCNGEFLTSGSEDGKAVLYDLKRSQQKSASVLADLTGHTSSTCSIASHPTRSDVVLTASYDGACVVWANHRDYMRWED